MGTEQDVDERALWQAADRYAELRRRWWLTFISMPAFGLIGCVLAPLCAELDHPLLAGLAGLASMVGFLLTYVRGFIAWMQLCRFLCPCCEKRFIVSRWGRQLSDRCCHCGLDLGPGRPKVVDLPRGEEYEWKRDYPGRDPGGA